MSTGWPDDRVLYYRPAPRTVEKATVPVARNAGGAARKVRVGIWDLDTSAGSLPRLLAEVESKQDYFSFYSVVAPFQGGMTTPGPSVLAEWRARVAYPRMTKAESELNVSAIRLYQTARPVLAKLPVDWLVMVVSSMISDVADRNDPGCNLFASSNGHTLAVSTYGLREFAAEGGRPFEVAVLGCVLAILVNSMVPKVEFLDQSTGSIFDQCIVRHDIVKCIQNPHIDPVNRAVIPPEILGPTERVIEALKSYAGTIPPEEMKRQLKAIQASNKKRAKASALKSRRFHFGAALKALQATIKTPAKSPVARKKKLVRRK